MSTYSVAVAVTTDIHLSDDQGRDVAAAWAALMADMPGANGFDLGMTSTSRDDPWLRVSGLVHGVERRLDVGDVQAALMAVLARAGATVVEWEALEVWSTAEMERRRRQPSIPPTVTAAELAALAGLKSVQRIYQYDSERKAGKRDDFPAPVLDGYWLRSVAEHWAATRKTRPGPAAKVKA